MHGKGHVEHLFPAVASDVGNVQQQPPGKLAPCGQHEVRFLNNPNVFVFRVATGMDSLPEPAVVSEPRTGKQEVLEEEPPTNNYMAMEIQMRQFQTCGQTMEIVPVSDGVVSAQYSIRSVTDSLSLSPSMTLATSWKAFRSLLVTVRRSMISKPVEQGTIVSRG